MSSFEAFILGLVQGLTEFLPVSSSGHLAIGKHLFGIDSGNLTFEILVHAATVLATIVVFRKEIWDLLCGLFKFKYNSQTRYIAMICVSMIPVLIVGVFFKDKVEALFGSGLTVVGCALLLTAALLLLGEWLSSRKKAPEGEMNYKTAAWMGLAQAIAVIPGLSRSGSTIATGLMCGTKRSEVAQFSFLMVLVPILGEAFLDLVGGDLTAGSGIGTWPLIIGFVSAFLSGMFACKVMIALVKKAKLKWFALYCALVGIACLFNFFM
jgi:undecaprenyl-diphosphatase